ncbi:MAG: hypothetical protein PHS41_12195, partial [Victivallaceae bacterium]|nr:hypothetical protein [Victivallaceae bacterium]
MRFKQHAIWQLTMLVAIHFTVDMFSGFLPGVLPVLIQKYNLSIGFCGGLVALMGLSSNLLQMWAGTLRREAHRPRLVQLGVLLAGFIAFLGCVPPGPLAIPLLILLVLVTGTGVALVHPEALRGVYGLPQTAVESSLATPIFMMVGFFGFAAGAFVAGTIAEFLGLKGLLLLLIPLFALLILFHRLQPKLAGDAPSEPSKENSSPNAVRLTATEEGKTPSLCLLFFLSVLLNTGCTILQGLLPSFLHQLGHSLSVSGFAALLFGTGAGIGALLLGWVLVRRFSLLRLLAVGILTGIVLLITLLYTGESTAALFLILPCGLLLGSGFPQIVVLARRAKSQLGLGARMGLIVGGSWGVAGLLFFGVSLLAERFPLRVTLLASPIAFLLLLPLLAWEI